MDVKKDNINPKNWIKVLFQIAVLNFVLINICFLITAHIKNTNIFFGYYKSPLTFFANYIITFSFLMMIYAVTGSVRFSFAMNLFVFPVICLINEYKVKFRSQTLKMNDFSLYREALQMVKKYRMWENLPNISKLVLPLILIVILILLVKKIKISKKQRLIFFAASVILFLSSITLVYNYKFYMKLGNKSNVDIYNEIEAYRAKGAVYSFTYFTKYLNSSNYKDYNKKEAKQLASSYQDTEMTDDQKVNIIAIMLESYKDFSDLDSSEIEFTKDPYEYFHKLKENSLSTNIIPDVYGGGTINTECQMVTGYRRPPTFSVGRNTNARYLKSQGYHTAAFHPNSETFYNRKAIYKSSGFDKFMAYENYFKDIENSKTDKVFFTNIIKYMNENQDKPLFLFAVTLQNHGPYEDKKLIGESFIKRTEKYSDTDYNYINNYLNNINDTGENLKILVDGIENTNRPTILILFGDHSPTVPQSLYDAMGMKVDENNFAGFKDKYETPLIVYANKSAKKTFSKDFKGKINSCYNPMFIFPLVTDYMGIKGSKYNSFIQDMSKNINYTGEKYNIQKSKVKNQLDDEGKKLLHDFHNFETYYKSEKIK